MKTLLLTAVPPIVLVGLMTPTANAAALARVSERCEAMAALVLQPDFVILAGGGWL